MNEKKMLLALRTAQESANKRNAAIIAKLFESEPPYTVEQLRNMRSYDSPGERAFARRGMTSRTLTLEIFKAPLPIQRPLFRAKCSCGKASKPFKLAEPKSTNGWIKITESGIAPIPYWDLDPEVVKFKKHKCN